MIEINLLPGARKKTKSSGSSSVDVRAMFGGLAERFKDPWLGFAIGGAVVGLGVIGWLEWSQRRERADLVEQERIAVQDSAKYDVIVKDMRKIEAQRDSIVRQMAVIAAIDGERFVWPHVMDEISRALPTYTWLKTVNQSNGGAVITPEQIAAGLAPKMAIRVIGITVDVQAVTIFAKQLEASPFLEGVVIQGTKTERLEGKDVIEFTFDMTFSKPEASAIRTTPLTIAVR